jgi:hypothetical protein
MPRQAKPAEPPPEILVAAKKLVTASCTRLGNAALAKPSGVEEVHSKLQQQLHLTDAAVQAWGLQLGKVVADEVAQFRKRERRESEGGASEGTPGNGRREFNLAMKKECATGPPAAAGTLRKVGRSEATKDVKEAIADQDTALMLIDGHPGAGKTTLGKLIKEKYNVDFFDLDPLCPQKVGKRDGEFQDQVLQNLKNARREAGNLGAPFILTGCGFRFLEGRDGKKELINLAPHLRPKKKFWLEMKGCDDVRTEWEESMRRNAIRLFIPDPDGEDEETRVGITTADALEAKVAQDMELEFVIKTAGRKGQRRAEWRHRETGCTAVFALAPEVEGHDPAQVRFRVEGGVLQAGYAPFPEWQTVLDEPGSLSGWLTHLAPWSFIPIARDFNIDRKDWKQKIGKDVYRFVELDAQINGPFMKSRPIAMKHEFVPKSAKQIEHELRKMLEKLP